MNAGYHPSVEKPQIPQVHISSAHASLPQFSTWRGGVDAIWAPRFISAVECAMRVLCAEPVLSSTRRGKGLGRVQGCKPCPKSIGAKPGARSPLSAGTAVCSRSSRQG